VPCQTTSSNASSSRRFLEDWETFLYAVAGRGFSPAEHSRRVDLMRWTMTPEDWDAHGRAQRTSNLEADLPRLEVPTLVMHPRDYPRLSPDHSMKVAALIPGARFQLLDGADIHGDPSQGLAAIDAFVNGLPSTEEAGSESGSAPDHLSSRELEVLRLLAAGRSNAQIADELVISLNTVNRHVSNIYAKTGAANRAEAAAYATRNGIV
jgi:DNA-binding CsgD family transcriptional regulator